MLNDLSIQFNSLLTQIPLLGVVLGYLSGMLPFAVIIAKVGGVNPMRSGSKNPGASNVGRLLGLKWGVIVLLFDSMKGFLPVWLMLDTLGLTWSSVVGVSAVIGHCYSPILSGKGGRGVATSLGALVALHSGLASISGLIWIMSVFITRKAAYASLILALTLLVLSSYADVHVAIHLFSLAVASLIIVRHWSYVKQLSTVQKKRRSQIRWW